MQLSSLKSYIRYPTPSPTDTLSLILIDLKEITNHLWGGQTRVLRKYYYPQCLDGNYQVATQ